MGILGLLKRKHENRSDDESDHGLIALGSPTQGKLLQMADVPDPVFSSGALGTCCGVEPTEGKIYSPIRGKITQVADTLHAIGLEGSGVEVLIHVGIDTVALGGKGFRTFVKSGKAVKKGDLLMEVDLETIRNAGLQETVIMAVINTDDFTGIAPAESDSVGPGDDVLFVTR